MHTARCLRIVLQAAIVLALMGGLSGCQTVAHRDNILFGTDTKFGIDIAPATTGATAAQFTVGYKRIEFVNMPLLVNAVDSKACGAGAESGTGKPCAGSSLADAKYVSKGGEAGNREDAYSVFASFGAEFGGGSNGTAGGLAQFFATGNAAQSLGENTSIGRALKVQAAGSEAVEAVEAANDALAEALSASEKRQQIEAATGAAGRLEDRLNAVIAIASPGGTFDKSKWDLAVDKLAGDRWSGSRTLLKSYSTVAEIRSSAPDEVFDAVDPLFEANVVN